MSNDHYVPQHFLRGWSLLSDTNKMGLAYKYIRQTTRIVVQPQPSIVSSSSQENLNSFAAGGKHISFEDVLSKSVDDPGSRALASLRQNGLSHLRAVEKLELSKYIFLLETRNPAVMTQMEVSPSEIVSTIQGSPAAKQEAIDALGELSSTGAYASAAFATWGHRRYAKFLKSLEWLEISAPTGYEFITSSYPVGRLGEYEDASGPVIFLATSPSTALAIASATRIRTIRCDDPLIRARAVDLMTIARATVAYSRSSLESEFVKKHLGWMHRITGMSQREYFTKAMSEP